MIFLRLCLLVAVVQAFFPHLAHTRRSRHSTANHLSSTGLSAATLDYQAKIDACNDVLKRAADTKQEDPDEVFEALSDLEKLMREKCKAEPKTAQQILDNLNGTWRLIFTTGTQETQKRRGGARINYFPIKAEQSFSTETVPYKISNGISIGDFSLVKFFGDFEFNLKSRKLEFDFDLIRVLIFDIKLAKGQAAQLGSSSGLGSESNVENSKKGKKAFFNWISADDSIATARGGGGGLALWKRVVEEKS
jgi:hypothetical protein